jgi:MoxR-like ATPase
MTPHTSAAAKPSIHSTELLSKLQQHIEKVFVGKSSVVRHSLTTFLAGGHLLIEDVPGVGKTTLALSLAKATGCSFQRIQLTSDLLPSDIVGISLLNPKTNDFEFRRGPLFHQVILADELNRATPRTQGALLEAMNERQVTMDNATHPLPAPFFVIATQNPHEHHGTFPLPESQLDRFMMRISIGYPDAEHEKTILTIGADIQAYTEEPPVLTAAEVLACMDAASRVTVAPVIDEYILSIVRKTREGGAIEVGVSPRGAIALRKAAQAFALLEGRAHVLPDDVKALAVPVLSHRLVLTSDHLSDLRSQAEHAITAIVEKTLVPL